jgi:hypothetical protein
MTAERPDLALLADLDAGLFDPARAAQARAAAATNPRSATILSALAATRAELASVPTPAVPPEIAARWAAALEREAASAGERSAGIDPVEAGPCPTGTSGDPADVRAPARPRRGTRPSHRAGSCGPPGARPSLRTPLRAAGAALVLAALVIACVLWPRSAPLPSLDRVNLAAAARAAIGTTDVGELADADRRAGCLMAVALAVPPAAPLLGGRRVELDSREAVLLVLASGRLGTFHVVVVDPGCGPAGGTLLASGVIGG